MTGVSEEKTRGLGSGGYRTRTEPSSRNKSAEKFSSREIVLKKLAK
jgi:hypothetical protein